MNRLIPFVFAIVSAICSLASEVTVTLSLNHPDMAKVRYLYFPGGLDLNNQILDFDNNGICRFTFPDETVDRALDVIPISETEPVYLKSFTIYDSTGEIIQEATVNRSSYYTIYITDEMNGGVIVIDVGPLEDYVLNFTLKGSPDYLSLMMIGAQEVTDITEGYQEIKYNPSENYIYIVPNLVDKFYSVTYNGVEQPLTSSANEDWTISYYYYITDIRDGGELQIIVTEEAGIGQTIVDNSKTTIYDISGHKMDGSLRDLPSGIYIINNDKGIHKVKH